MQPEMIANDRHAVSATGVGRCDGPVSIAIHRGVVRKWLGRWPVLCGRYFRQRGVAIPHHTTALCATTSKSKATVMKSRVGGPLTPNGSDAQHITGSYGRSHEAGRGKIRHRREPLILRRHSRGRVFAYGRDLVRRLPIELQARLEDARIVVDMGPGGRVEA